MQDCMVVFFWRYFFQSRGGAARRFFLQFPTFPGIKPVALIFCRTPPLDATSQHVDLWELHPQTPPPGSYQPQNHLTIANAAARAPSQARCSIGLLISFFWLEVLCTENQLSCLFFPPFSVCSNLTFCILLFILFTTASQ